MKSLSIISDDAQLYSVYHPAKYSPPTASIDRHAIVICSPVTNEHDSTYWALKQLSFRLSRSGFDVFRFDYFATGNSFGTSSQFSIKTSIKNICDVTLHIKNTLQIEKISFIGLRAGAILAALSSSACSPYHLLYWEPITSGKVYLQQMRQMHQKFLKKMHRSPGHKHTLGEELLGYPYPENLIDEIIQLRLDQIKIPESTNFSIVTDLNDAAQKQCIEKISLTRSFHKIEGSTIEKNWQDINTLETSFLPNQAIMQITRIFKGL